MACSSEAASLRALIFLALSEASAESYEVEADGEEGEEQDAV